MIFSIVVIIFQIKDCITSRLIFYQVSWVWRLFIQLDATATQGSTRGGGYLKIILEPTHL